MGGEIGDGGSSAVLRCVHGTLGAGSRTRRAQRIMICLHSESKVRSHSGRLARWILVLFMLALLLLVVERSRGQRILRLWKQKTATQDEFFQAKRLWPSASAYSQEFSNRLANALQQLPPELGQCARTTTGPRFRVGEHRSPGKSRTTAADVRRDGLTVRLGRVRRSPGPEPACTPVCP